MALDLSFHFHAPNKLTYACKLLRKAARSGVRTVVVAPEDFLTRLDRELWTFSPVDFVSHVRADLADKENPQSLLALNRSAVLLCSQVDQSNCTELLVNLGADVPDGFDRFARLIDVVGQGDAEVQTGRQRWKHYKALGHEIVRHDLNLSS
jgi:DNA polymerase-3 subunit chi